MLRLSAPFGGPDPPGYQVGRAEERVDCCCCWGLHGGVNEGAVSTVACRVVECVCPLFLSPPRALAAREHAGVRAACADPQPAAVLIGWGSSQELLLWSGAAPKERLPRHLLARVRHSLFPFWFVVVYSCWRCAYVLTFSMYVQAPPPCLPSGSWLANSSRVRCNWLPASCLIRPLLYRVTANSCCVDSHVLSSELGFL